MRPPVSAGAMFLSEIHEQPDALARVAGHGETFGDVADEIRRRGVRLVRMVGHGSSDNAASYGVYAFGLLAGLTAFRESISLSVYYGAGVDLSDSCILALSQSGRTPDVVDYVERAARRGTFTVAATNDTASPLARAADAVLPLSAGVEQSIAATKTYTTQVASLALLAAHVGGDGARYEEGLHAVAALLREWLPRAQETVVPVAAQLVSAGRMLAVGRGPEFATAREVSLKLLETCRVAAGPLTATDLAHGPVAALDLLFPVWVIAGDDAGLPTVVEAAARARAAGAPLIATGAAASAIDGAAFSIPIPVAPAPLLAPLLSVVPGQLLAWALARAKGFDPDHPAGLAKVTLVP